MVGVPTAKQKLESGEADFLNGLFYDGTLFWRADHEKHHIIPIYQMKIL